MKSITLQTSHIKNLTTCKKEEIVSARDNKEEFIEKSKASKKLQKLCSPQNLFQYEANGKRGNRKIQFTKLNQKLYCDTSDMYRLTIKIFIDLHVFLPFKLMIHII